MRACMLLAAALAFLGAAAPSIIATPRVMVFPVQAEDGSMGRETTAQIATMLATRMAAGEKVIVLPPPAGIDRKDYAGAAAHAGADYYVSGYVVALAGGVSMVLHVVSVRTGIVVYSTSGQVHAAVDVAAQGDLLRDGLSRYLEHYLAPYAALPTPGPQATPSAGPSPAATGRR